MLCSEEISVTATVVVAWWYNNTNVLFWRDYGDRDRGGRVIKTNVLFCRDYGDRDRGGRGGDRGGDRGGRRRDRSDSRDRRRSRSRSRSRSGGRRDRSRSRTPEKKRNASGELIITFCHDPWHFGVDPDTRINASD